MKCYPTLSQGQCHVESIENVRDSFSSPSQPLMNNLTLFWNSSYQIPKYLFSTCIMCGDSYPLSMKWQSCYFQNVCVKKSNLHRTLLSLWSVHVCSVLPCFHWPLWRRAWNNGKLLVEASLLNAARRLDHCDIASLALRAEQSWHPKPNVIHGNSLGPNTSRVLHMGWKHGYQTQQFS